MPQAVTKLPDEVAARLFTEGCILLFKSWTDYQLILAHADDIPEEARDLPEDIANWYVQEGLVYADELDAYLEQFFDEKCHAVLSDDAAASFAADVVHLYNICVRQDSTAYETFMRAIAPADISTSKTVAVPMAADDEGSVSEEDSDGEPRLPQQAGHTAPAASPGGPVVGGLVHGDAGIPFGAPAAAAAAAVPAAPKRTKKPKATMGDDGWITNN